MVAIGPNRELYITARLSIEYARNPRNGPDSLPVVYRWAYDYSVPGYEDDFIPQNVPPSASEGGSST